uniref:F-box domain-containing protein n=1 Tax=Megaviridae environmental sample TaxID=1737588 RepID=A0A5J6VKX7_9VIRU|nr:MAG: hypothetical protein [Megaviridae environmental sample]
MNFIYKIWDYLNVKDIQRTRITCKTLMKGYPLVKKNQMAYVPQEILIKWFNLDTLELPISPEFEKDIKRTKYYVKNICIEKASYDISTLIVDFPNICKLEIFDCDDDIDITYPLKELFINESTNVVPAIIDAMYVSYIEISSYNTFTINSLATEIYMDNSILTVDSKLDNLTHFSTNSPRQVIPKWMNLKSLTIKHHKIPVDEIFTPLPQDNMRPPPLVHSSWIPTTDTDTARYILWIKRVYDKRVYR